MGQFTQNGVTYEELPNGKVRVVGYAPVISSPTQQYAVPKAAAEAATAQAAAANIPEEREKLRQANIAAERENMQFVGDPSKHGADYINSIPANYENYRNIIPMIAHNQVQVGNVARSNNEAKLLIAGAKQFDPHYDPSLASIRANALQAYTGNGDASTKIQAADRAANALSLLKEYSDQMGGPNTGYSPLNSLIAGNQQDTGARLIAAKKFDALLPEAMGQLNTVLAGSTTVSGMKEIKEGLDPHASQAERNAAFEAYAHALTNAVGDLKQGWNSAYGGTAAPPVWLSPQNAAFLEKMTGAKQGSLGENDFHGLPGLNPDGTYNPNGPRPASPPVSSAALPPNAADFQLSDKTAAQTDPVLKAATQHIGAMIAGGAPDDKILQAVQQMGVDPAKTNVPQILQYRQTPDFANWQNQHLGQPYPIDPRSFTRDLPLSPARRLFNQAASTDLGGDLTAGTLAAGNSFFANQTTKALGALGGDPAMAQVGMDLMRQNHPLSSLAGDIGGQVGLEALGSTIPGANLILGSRLGRIAADAAYGGAYGSGNGGSGALPGAVLGAAGGMFGRGVQSGIGKVATGVQNKALQYLDSQGIPLTLGQMGHGSNNIVGKAIGGIEDRAAGFPGFDAVINSARQRGIAGFNQAAFKQAGVDGGLTGADGLSALGDIKNNAYNFINPLSLPIDAQFAGSQAAVRAGVPAFPAFGDEVGKTLNQIDNVSQNGVMSGQNWQSALRDVKANKANIVGKPFAGDPNATAEVPTGAASALGQVQDNLLGLADRQGPPGTVDALNSANRVNAQFNTLSSALDNSAAQRAGQMFSPLQLDNASRVNTRKFGGRLASLTGQNRPFYDLTQAGLQVMPNQVPDSGTAGRFWLLPLATGMVGGIGGALGGGEGNKEEDGGLGLGYGAALGLAAGGPYSKAGQNVIQRALLNDRLPIETKIGNYLINNRAKGGMFGQGLARDYANYMNSYLNQPIGQ